MKNFDVYIKDCACYNIEAETKEEAILQALNYLSERKPEIICEENEEVS